MTKAFLKTIVLSVVVALCALSVAHADVLLTDNFLVSSNSQNLNQELGGRQAGTLAPAIYTGWNGQHQVGNSTTDVGQPGGAANSNFVLLAFDGGFFSDLNIGSVATGPLTIEFDMYMTGANNPSTDPTTWGACTLRVAGDPFPVAGAGEFGFLQRVNGGMQVFQSGGNIAPGNWDTVGFATNTHWTLIFSDAAGTGSAFNGNGSQVTFVNGTNTLGTLPLGQLNSAGLRLGFRDVGDRFVGIDNISISGTSASLPPPGNNLSFEYDTTLPGNSIEMVPTSWTGFNGGHGDFGTEYAGGNDYTVFSPLAPTATGNEFCYINKFNGGGVGGIYQDMGPLQPNSVYTLTVAIGSRADRINSPGIISLVNGTDNTGTVLATGGGLPSTQDTWQDYTVTFSTGGSVSGDLTIVLAANGASSIQADFDNVRLNIQQSAVPLPALITNTTPASATIASGSNVIFSAAFSNSPPVTLQWQKVVSGVTNDINTGVVTVTNNGIVSSTLTLVNAQFSDSGSYRLKAVNATNLVTVVYTTLAPLNVIPTITWYAPGAYNSGFSDDSVLALAGPVANEVYGVDFGGSGLLTTGNGYTFDDYNSSGNMALNGTVTIVGGYLSGAATTGDGNFDLILNNGVAGSSGNTGTLKNLTVGQAYTVLLVLDDTRSSPGGSTFHVTDGETVSPDQQYAFANGTPKVGGYIMGTFTAQATNQPLSVFLNNGNSQYNAILLMKGTAAAPTNAPTLTKDVTLLSEVATGTPMTLSVTAAGSTPLYYHWFNQGGAISGQTNSSYSFNASSGTNSFYVSVSNAFGVVTSSTAVVISATNIITVANFSFEADVTANGQDTHLPVTGWTAFNVGANDWIGTGHPNSAQYTVNNPLAAPADGSQYCWVNIFNPTPLGGIYQDVGPLETNTVYTLTVAIGSRVDRINSPGIISLIKGTNNSGNVVATGGGLPATQDTWQDYTISFTNGTSTGDLTIELAANGAGTIQADFDNVRLTKAPAVGPPPPPAIHNPSFEAGTGSIPAFWSAFNDNNFSIVTPASGGDYTVFNPLAPTADGNNFFGINEGPSDPTGGIYQVFDALKPNTTYTLTVAIGRRADFGPSSGLGSPGIISLINGDNNTGTVLASTNGIPATPDTWQDYTVSYTTGSSVTGNLTVELSVAGASTYQANFDNVRLTVTPFVPAPIFGAPRVSGANLILTASGGSANGAYTLLTTTNLESPNWTTNSTGNLDGFGAFSNAIPIGSAPASFYRVRVP
jgi:hypothetical protein